MEVIPPDLYASEFYLTVPISSFLVLQVDVSDLLGELQFST